MSLQAQVLIFIIISYYSFLIIQKKILYQNIGMNCHNILTKYYLDVCLKSRMRWKTIHEKKKLFVACQHGNWKEMKKSSLNF